MFKFGWFSSGSDQAAINLFEAVLNHTEKGFIKGKIAFVFCDREFGETPASDRFISSVKARGIPLITHSSRDLRNKIAHGVSDISLAREKYDSEVIEILKDFGVEILVMAGYMLIISSLMCRTYLCLNLHPAAPMGPKGTWRQVMWRLIASRAKEAGGMMHLATPELDAGPPVTYFRFPIEGPLFDDLWFEFSAKLCAHGLREIKAIEGESEPLFSRIREEELRREFPLIILTLKCLCEGHFRLTHEGAVNKKGRLLPYGYNLSNEVDKYERKFYPRGEEALAQEKSIIKRRPRKKRTTYSPQIELPYSPITLQ